MTASDKRSWEPFSRKMREFVSRRVSDPNDVDDILQDIFLKMHTRLGTLKDETRLTPWLYRIARNTIIDHYRSRKIQVPVTDELPDNKEIDEDTPARHIAGGLGKMIGCLPEKYSEAIKLAELDGLPLREIAKRTGLTLAGAKSRVQRGRALLHAELTACCHFEFDRRGGLIDYVPKSRCCRQCKHVSRS